MITALKSRRSRLTIALVVLASSNIVFAEVFHLADITKTDYESLNRDQTAFAMVAGALYFRLIVMRGDVNKAWLDKVLQLFPV